VDWWFASTTIGESRYCVEYLPGLKVQADRRPFVFAFLAPASLRGKEGRMAPARSRAAPESEVTGREGYGLPCLDWGV
jgi:hypothetical protein